MAVTHLVLQASGAMFKTLSPAGWTYCFGVYVCDNEGKPCEGLKKKNFSVWQLSDIGESSLRLAMELNVDFPSSKMPGIYRLQTEDGLPMQALQPQEFIFAIRAHVSRNKSSLQGFTTVPITYLGDWH